mgnify:FL=1
MFEDVIIKELNAVFEKLLLPPIPKKCECEVILCIMSLLQFSCIRSNDGRIQGYLYIDLCDDGLFLIDDVMDAGLGSIVLRVIESQYQNLVSEQLEFTSEPLRLKRVGTDLKVILP